MGVNRMSKIIDTKIQKDLFTAIERAYKPCGLEVHTIIQEPESQEYGACEFVIDHKHVKFRTSKITPTKVGQFVTIWKRNNGGPIIPFDVTDPIDFFIISARSSNHSGQFIFPKSVLIEKGYVSVHGKGGKRAMRVYPSWDIVDSSIAKKTQAWQLHYFVEIHADKPLDKAKIIKLLSQ
jgi:hypothetical protein